jgi:hypothetical protein
VQRILPLRKEAFLSDLAWAFQIFAIPQDTRELAQVLQAYRRLMLQLHPDRAREASEVETQSKAAAVELVLEAKGICERRLGLAVVKPSAPCFLDYKVLDYTRGRRSFDLCWPAAEESGSSIQSYELWMTMCICSADETRKVAEVDPVPGCTHYSHVIKEQDFDKMPEPWAGSTLRIGLTAANSAGGRSDLVGICIPLAPFPFNS